MWALRAPSRPPPTASNALQVRQLAALVGSRVVQGAGFRDARLAQSSVCHLAVHEARDPMHVNIWHHM